MFRGHFALSNTGSLRDENQDAYRLDPKGGWLALADGMGGLPNGRMASEAVLESLANLLQSHGDPPLALLFSFINEAVKPVGFSHDPMGFGSTLTYTRYLPEKGQLEIGHIGDSSAYLVHKGLIRELTIEHTVAAREARMPAGFRGVITEADRHTLTQCLGQMEFIDPHIDSVRVCPGDRVFLFSDGVTKPLDQDLLYRWMRSSEPIEHICQQISFRVEKAGSPDNYTLVVAELGDAGA